MRAAAGLGTSGGRNGAAVRMALRALPHAAAVLTAAAGALGHSACAGVRFVECCHGFATMIDNAGGPQVEVVRFCGCSKLGSISARMDVARKSVAAHVLNSVSCIPT